MCRVEYPLRRLVWKYVIYIVLMLGVGNFFIEGVLIDHIGIGGRMLEFIGKLLIGIKFLL